MNVLLCIFFFPHLNSFEGCWFSGSFGMFYCPFPHPFHRPDRIQVPGWGGARRGRGHAHLEVCMCGGVFLWLSQMSWGPGSLSVTLSEKLSCFMENEGHPKLLGRDILVRFFLTRPLPCMSQRLMKLDVRCVITATLVCPPGGVNSGHSTSLDMIHCVTHSGKEAPEGMLFS